MTVSNFEPLKINAQVRYCDNPSPSYPEIHLIPVLKNNLSDWGHFEFQPACIQRVGTTRGVKNEP